MDKSEKFPTFSFILLILALGPSIALAGFVLTQLWLWFVVPLGLPALGILHAMGLQLAATVLTGGVATIRTLEEIKTTIDDSPSKSVKETVQKGWVAMVTGACASLLIWGVGALFALGI